MALDPVATAEALESAAQTDEVFMFVEELVEELVEEVLVEEVSIDGICAVSTDVL
jgi:mycofactocin precursor